MNNRDKGKTEVVLEIMKKNDNIRDNRPLNFRYKG